MIRTLVLDLDGTLIDSVPDLTASCNRVLASRGIAQLDENDVKMMVGDGAPALVAKIMAARGMVADPQGLLREFLSDYMAHPAERTRPYQGVPETLEQLQADGWRLAVCTNKPIAAARLILEKLGLLGAFAAIGGGDSYAVRKPDPGHLLATLAEAGGHAAAAVMVGDHLNDLLAAKAAGVACIFAEWGYGQATMIDGANGTATSFTEVPRIAAALLDAATGAYPGRDD